MELNIPRPAPRTDGDYRTYADIGYGKPYATIHLAENGALDLTSVSVEDCDRLIRAAAKIKEQLLGFQAKAEAPHGRANVYQGTCQLCGKPEADELHAEPPVKCRSCEIEPATEGDFCEACAPAALLAASIAAGTPVLVDDDDPRCKCGHQQTLHDEGQVSPCRAVACGCTRFRSATPDGTPAQHSGRHPDEDRAYREAMATLSAGGHTNKGLAAMREAEASS